MTTTRVNSQKQHQNFYRLLNHAWQHSAFYRDYYGSHGIKESDLAEITVRDLPLVTKKTLMDNFNAVVTDSRLRKHQLEQWIQDNPDPRANFLDEYFVVHSSGCSGAVGIYIYDRRAWHFANATIANHLPLPKNSPADRTRVAMYLASHGHFAGVSTAVRMPADIYDVRIHSVLEDADHVVAQLNSFQPQRIGGYSSSVATLAESALQGRLRICPKTILVSGDKLSASMEQNIRDAWNAPVHVLYSASESLCIAVKSPGSDDMAVLDDLNVLEVLDNHDEMVSPGATGRAVLTNLYNYTLPIIRYELGDHLVLGAASGKAGVKSLRDIQGRLRDALPVVLGNGENDTLHPIVLAEFFVPGVKKIQFVSLRPEHVLLKYEADSDLDALIQREFQRILEIKGATRTRYEVQRKEHIPNDPKTGKFMLVKSEYLETDRRSEVVTIQSSSEGIATQCSASRALGFSQPSQDEIEHSVTERFEKQARSNPKRMAVRTKVGSVTYQELNAAAHRVAQAIVAKRGQGQEPIALLLDSGAAIIAAILGVLKAGKLYMPLDPSFPSARIKAMLEDSKAGLILTDNRHFTLTNESAGRSVQVINLDDLESGLSSENPNLALSADSLACILYTSGSTGEPKGVVHSHRNILHKTSTYTQDLQLSAEDRIALLSPCTFSLSVGFIFGALLNGACLYPVDVKSEGLTHLAHWFAQEKVTVYNSVPTTFRKFADTLSAGEPLPDLRLIHLGGEPVTGRDIELFKGGFSADCVLVHHWGCNEAGTIAQCFIDHNSAGPGDATPVGQPGAGSEILVLDDQGTPLGFNRVGEIAVKSRYLAVEYWRNPELTRAVFLADPEGGEERIYRTGDLGLLRSDGSVEHHGRKDFQIKIRGQKVAVAEIETALAAHGAIKEAIVTAQKNGRGDQQLVAYVVSRRDPVPSSKELRLFLQQRMPEYMIPSAFVVMDALPLTANGKLDRKALPVPEWVNTQLGSSYVPPTESVEHQLVAIWEELLQVHPIGINDDFFDLGGHSLLAIQMMDRIERACGEKLPLTTLLAGPTIKNLAKVLVEQRYTDDMPLLMRIQAGNRKRPFFFLHGDYYGGGFYCLNLARALNTDQTFYALAPHGVNGGYIPPTIEAMAASYIEMMRSVEPSGPYILGGHCNGGIVALEMARQLVRQGQRVDLVALVSAWPWNGPVWKSAQFLISAWSHLIGLGAAETRDLFLKVREIGQYYNDRAKYAQRLSLAEQAGWVLRRARGTLQGAARLFMSQSYGETRENSPASGTGPLSSQMPIHEIYHNALCANVPGSYSGRVALFWPADHATRSLDITELAWRKVAPKIEIEVVPGGHHSSLTVHVDALARSLNAQLDKLDQIALAPFDRSRQHLTRTQNDDWGALATNAMRYDRIDQSSDL